MTRLVMKLKQLVGAEGKSSVRSAIVIAEFDLVHTGSESLDHCADLAAQKVMVSDVFEQCNHRQQFEFAHGVPDSYSTKQLVSRGTDSPVE